MNKIILLSFLLLAGCASLPPEKFHPPGWAKVGYTGSMYPALKGGETLWVENIPFSKLKVGDVVLRRVAWEKDLVIHRVVAIRGNRIVTAGDHNSFYDAWWMTPDEYFGRVVMPLTNAKKPGKLAIVN